MNKSKTNVYKTRTKPWIKHKPNPKIAIERKKKKENSLGDADRTFPNRHHPNIIQGLNRKYNSRHRSL